MNHAHPTAVKPLAIAQPLLELLHAADAFGADFDRPGDPQHLREALANVRSLKERALFHAWRVGAGHEDAAEFLRELAQDFSEIEQNIAGQLTVSQKAKAA